MLYEVTNTPAVARTSNLNEELGQVLLALTFRMNKIMIKNEKKYTWFIFVNTNFCAIMNNTYYSYEIKEINTFIQQCLHQFSNLEWFLKNHVRLKPGEIAALKITLKNLLK